MRMKQDMTIAEQTESLTAARQLLWMGLAAVAAFVVLLFLLSWVAARTGGGQAAGNAIDGPGASITLAYPFEPPQLDGTKATDVASSFVLGHVMEGLLRLDEHGAIVPAVAESWQIEPNRATFHLRTTAVWSDGKPVTAPDFVFAWRKVVDPATASEYAFIMYAVMNAEAVTKGEMPVEKLGVRALDDRTLVVEFQQPVAYFDKLVTFKTYLPIREDFYNSRKGRYGADADDLLFNGPFTLARWVHGAQLRFEKSPQYWNRDAIRLNAVNIPYITTDGAAMMNLYKDGKIAMVGGSLGLDPEQLKDVMSQRWPMQRFNEGALFFIEFNHRANRLTRNANLRKALQLAFDQGELVNQVIKLPGYLPGHSLFPVWLRGADGLFRQEHPVAVPKVDVAAARRHLELARKELGLASWPPIALLSDDRPLTVRITEYLQARFKETLGLEIRIDRQIFKQRLAKMTSGDFDMVTAGWSPDYDDPMTFGDLFASWNLNNRGRYDNPQLDRQVRNAMASLDPQTRMNAFAKVQDIMVEDAVIIPMYERGQVFVSDPRLQGVVRRVVGTDPDFTHAYVTQGKR
jgi:oligopeptide transport system substrate-binding protein